MAATKLKLPVIEQGATYSHTLYWRKPGGIEPMDLNNCLGYMQIRAAVTDVEPLIELNNDTGRLTLDPSTGKIELYLSSAATKLITPTKDAVYDLELHYIDGTVVRLIEGLITISPEVTREALVV